MLGMGLCLGTEVTEEEKKARIHSAKIDRDLYEYAKREMNVVKILLLGETENAVMNSPETHLTRVLPESVVKVVKASNHLSLQLHIFQWMT